MSPEFWQSISLVVLGAAITLGTTLLVERLRGRQEDRREADRRAAAEQATLREQALGHALAVHDLLVQLQLALSGHITPVPEDELILGLRRRYLLVPDVEVRSALGDALTIGARRERDSAWVSDYRRAVGDCAFIVAAYLRGDRPPARYMADLSELRAKYTVPTAEG